jgi:GTPase SAR1 family protein
VYDITDATSYDRVKRYWINEIEQYCSEHVVKLIVGNKCDLAMNRAVDHSDAKDFCDSVNIPHMVFVMFHVPCHIWPIHSFQSINQSSHAWNVAATIL